MTEASFDPPTRESLLASSMDQPVIVDFWAPWCGPCKTMTPMAEAVAAEYADETRFVKIDIDAAPTVAEAYGVRAVPTFVRLDKGSEINRLSGLTSRTRLAMLFEGDPA